MIREVCSCGAEFETDDRDAIDLVKNWRRSHKHNSPGRPTRDSSTLSSTDIALGFQLNPEIEDDPEITVR